MNKTWALWCTFVIAAMALPAHSTEQAGRPNILVLMAEDMSARVGAFGDPVARTPNIDRLAQQGVRYPNTFTTAGVCAPSRAAHITGMHQIAMGGQHMRTSTYPDGGYLAVPPAEVKAYPELLRREGYFTWTDVKLDYQFSGSVFSSGPFTIWDAQDRDAHFRWRDRQPGQPFYGLVNFAVTHESGIFQPLGNWPNSMSHFVMQVMRALLAPDAPEMPPTDPETIVLPPYLPDVPAVRADIARHYDNIAIMDWEVGQILAGLEADGLAESTIVIWTTDHGDGLPRSKRELYDTGIKVPMVIRWPEKYRPAGVPAGAVDMRMVSFVDLAPTILRLAGAELPDYLQGRDLSHSEPRQYIFASRDRIDEVPDRQRAVRDRQYKYVRSWYPHLPGGHPLKFRDNLDMMQAMWSLLEEGKLNEQQRLWFEPSGKERLFDLDVDPWELNDLAGDPEYAQVLTRMRGALETWRNEVGDWSDEPEAQMVARFQPKGETPVTAAPSVSFAQQGMVLSSQTEGASLGYSLDEGDSWQLYVDPVAVPSGSVVIAKAVRYGFEESEEVEASAP